ncbi:MULTISPECIES: hypothetical protein [unclassified Campylobacter]|uniref:hypothetical protein n=1 Tax=unclassified Campylobacter TaxID=2593542 RepID=UPI001EFBF1FF|nr:hypothetical protein [Campylobacter sp. RM12651]MBZ7976013.1 hypothetical protein [Campylobacter sp. RM12637]ULO03416.1 hypothetical protein AVBRAN_0956 [Campylobacter sp. RM12651]
MKKALFLVILICFTACVRQNDEFYNSKEEIMLRSYYVNDCIISYLGVKDNNDYFVIASKNEIEHIIIEGYLVQFLKLPKNEFNLPYKNDFLYFYKIINTASKKTNIDMEITLNNEETRSVKIQRISKSLEYQF